MNSKQLGTLATLLVVIGGLNWGLIGLLHLNLVTSILGEASMLSTVVYLLVGVSALYIAATNFGKSK